MGTLALLRRDLFSRLRVQAGTLAQAAARLSVVDLPSNIGEEVRCVGRPDPRRHTGLRCDFFSNECLQLALKINVVCLTVLLQYDWREPGMPSPWRLVGGFELAAAKSAVKMRWPELGVSSRPFRAFICGFFVADFLLVLGLLLGFTTYISKYLIRQAPGLLLRLSTWLDMLLCIY